MRRLLSAVLLSVIVAGCATEGKYGQMLDTWMGMPESQLLSKWGAPSSAYESGGVKYLTYSDSASGYMPGTAPSYQSTVVGNTVYTNRVGGTPGFAFNRWCDTTFTVKSGVIVNWSWKGNACKAM